MGRKFDDYPGLHLPKDMQHSVCPVKLFHINRPYIYVKPFVLSCVFSFFV